MKVIMISNNGKVKVPKVQRITTSKTWIIYKNHYQKVPKAKGFSHQILIDIIPLKKVQNL